MAEDWSRKLENEIVQEKYFPGTQKPATHTVGDLIDIYIERIVPQKGPRTQRYQRRILLVITDSVDPAPRRSWSPKRASFLANCLRNICR